MTDSAKCAVALALLGGLGSALPVADAQNTGLTLDPVGPRANLGETVVFSGYLYTESSYVSGALVSIKDDTALGRDATVATAVTDSDGRFVAEWTARPRSSGSWDFYAEFGGSGDFDEARSSTHRVAVGAAERSSLTLDPVPPKIYAGQEATFTGRLASGGQPIAGVQVDIMEDDPLSPDQRLASAITDSNGRFLAPWTAAAGLLEVDFDIYAEFDGSAYNSHARSGNQEMSVLKYGGSIALDPVPSSVRIGEVIEFSGTLSIHEHDTRGAVVYIKDEDTFNPDDLLATAYVDERGRFSAGWRAVPSDPTSTLEIYAVFEGNSTIYRLTTCDPGATMSLGGSCSNTVPLRLLDPVPAPPTIVSGREYMELYYAFDFDQRPHIAIVPSPDSFDKVRGHIVPVQEGINEWVSDLERRHGGNWDVSFEVVEPKQRFQAKPDILVNLVTPEQDAGCVNDYYGWAYTSMARPVQTHVCSVSGERMRSNGEVAATAGHEFIHAMGLGHAFNKHGDLMCSAEDGVNTCEPLFPKSKSPSALNLDAVAAMYGADGFMTPNNNVARGERFYTTSAIPTPPEHTPPPERTAPELATPPERATPEPTTTSKCDRTYSAYDVDVDDTLEPKWFMTYAICRDGAINYSFETDNPYDGFRLYVLPPETDVQSFVNRSVGIYYTCEEPRTPWHSKSGTCNVEAGSSIVVENVKDNGISFTGRIWT